jgi:hypothetical protein
MHKPVLFLVCTLTSPYTVARFCNKRSRQCLTSQNTITGSLSWPTANAGTGITAQRRFANDTFLRALYFKVTRINIVPMGLCFRLLATVTCRERHITNDIYAMYEGLRGLYWCIQMTECDKLPFFYSGPDSGWSSLTASLSLGFEHTQLSYQISCVSSCCHCFFKQHSQMSIRVVYSFPLTKCRLRQGSYC